MTDVRIVEVGARDGLQNETQILPVAQRVELIRRLADSGLTTIEAGAFVSPKWVPQMADSDQVLAGVLSDEALRHRSFPVLTPNLKGYQAALQSGAREIAVFGAASESFTQKNINCSIDESLNRFADVCAQAKADGVRIRGYVSTVVACPYEGDIKPQQVLPVVERLLDMGCYEISLGDTIGRATPASINRLLHALAPTVHMEQLALHCHDTYGMAIANIIAGLEQGIRVFDASIGGAGGCPYADGASGNVATEELVYLLNGEGLHCGVSLPSLVATSHWLFALLGKTPVSKVAQALGSETSGKQS